jgi:hypothetical protein
MASSVRESEALPAAELVPRRKPAGQIDLGARMCVHECIQRSIPYCMAATVRIEQATHRALAEVARAKGITLQSALTCAVEAYRRQVFLEGLADDFARLRADRRAWTEEQQERAAWDQTLKDGADKK